LPGKGGIKASIQIQVDDHTPFRLCPSGDHQCQRSHAGRGHAYQLTDTTAWDAAAANGRIQSREPGGYRRDGSHKLLRGTADRLRTPSFMDFGNRMIQLFFSICHYVRKTSKVFNKLDNPKEKVLTVEVYAHQKN
jgi:hypothetical protein